MILQAPALPPPAPVRATLAEEVAAGGAIAAYELAWWRRNHPKADLALTFNDPEATPALVALVRRRLGYPNPLPVLDPEVLTLVLDRPLRSAPRRLTVEGFAFLGSFPKGFQARYLVALEGGKARVLTRSVLQRYELTKPASTTPPPTKT